MVERLAIDGDLSPWGSRSQFLIQPGFDFLMLKKLEPMIQLNSQEITEATELHPVTTCEQGGREDGKTGGL